MVLLSEGKKNTRSLRNSSDSDRYESLDPGRIPSEIVVSPLDFRFVIALLT